MTKTIQQQIKDANPEDYIYYKKNKKGHLTLTIEKPKKTEKT